jgi:hypothetical protein
VSAGRLQEANALRGMSMGFELSPQ